MSTPTPFNVTQLLATHDVELERVCDHLTAILAHARARINRQVRRADATVPYEVRLDEAGQLQLYEVVAVVGDDVDARPRGDSPEQLPWARARERDAECMPGDELLIPAALPREVAAAAYLLLRRDTAVSASERAAIEAVLAAMSVTGGASVDLPDRSIGTALRDDAFAGLKVVRAGTSLELRGSTLVAMRREYCEEQRWWYALDLCLHAGGVAYEILLHRDDYDGAYVLCEACHPEARPRLEAALGDWLAALDIDALATWESVATITSLLRAVLPPIDDQSLPHWIETTLLGLLQPEGAPIARACGPERTLELVCTQLGVEREFERFAVVESTMRLIVRQPDGTIEDIIARDMPLGRVGVGRVSQRLDPDALARAQGAVACWRGAAQRKLDRVVPEFDAHHLHDCMPGLGFIAMLELWIDQGPPGPRPCPLHLDEQVFDRAAASLIELDDEAMAPLRARLGNHAGLGYRIGAWTIVLGPYLVQPDQQVFWEDHLIPGNEAVTFVVATNSHSVLHSNFMVSPCLVGDNEHEILIREGYRSAAAAYNGALEIAKNDLIVFAHQDMIFPRRWISDLHSRHTGSASCVQNRKAVLLPTSVSANFLRKHHRCRQPFCDCWRIVRFRKALVTTFTYVQKVLILC